MLTSSVSTSVFIQFIHDLVTEIMKMLEDIPERLFYSRELDKNSFETKEQKTQYLEKLVSWARQDLVMDNYVVGVVWDRMG